KPGLVVSQGEVVERVAAVAIEYRSRPVECPGSRFSRSPVLAAGQRRREDEYRGAEDGCHDDIAGLAGAYVGGTQPGGQGHHHQAGHDHPAEDTAEAGRADPEVPVLEQQPAARAPTTSSTMRSSTPCAPRWPGPASSPTTVPP